MDHEGQVPSQVSDEARYVAAQAAFQALMNEDFPDFDTEVYAAEKAEAEGIDRVTLQSRIWSEARSVQGRLDVTGDGKLGLDDVEAMAKGTAHKLGRVWANARSIKSEDVGGAASAAGAAVARFGHKARSVDYGGAMKHAAQKAKDAAQSVDAQSLRSSGETLLKIGKTGVGVQGLQDRREALHTQEVCDEYAAAAEAVTDARRIRLNASIEDFGAQRLAALHETLGRFLKILTALNQNNKVKEYELLAGLGLDTKTLDSMGELDMTVAQTLHTTAAAGALGAAAVLGTPVLVTGAVTALATASTGTAISSLSGVAASNAVLAWLGGGSLAAGGGGMAAGGVVLAGITAGATAGVALLSAGMIVSTHYARKLTEAKSFEKDTALAVANLENAWTVMDGISRRVSELSSVTEELRVRLVPALDQLDEVVPLFDASNGAHASQFSKCGLLVKTMVELAQTPLLDDEGDLSDESLSITTHVKRILNTEV